MESSVEQAAKLNPQPMVVDGLLRHVAFPRGVTRNGILHLNPQMLARWKERIED